MQARVAEAEAEARDSCACQQRCSHHWLKQQHQLKGQHWNALELVVQQPAGPTTKPAARPAATKAEYIGARAAVNAQMEARKEKQERERALREEELAWLQEFDDRSSRYD